MDKRKNNKGTKGNKGGRPPKVKEDLAIERITRALREIYSQDKDEEAVNEFLKDFATEKEGKKFFAEHLLGKPKEQKSLDVSFLDVKPIEWVDEA